MLGAVENKLTKSFIKLFTNFKQTYPCTPKMPKAQIPQCVASRASIPIVQHRTELNLNLMLLTFPHLGSLRNMNCYFGELLK